MAPATVHILLATYNGERFLPDWLASLAAQTHENWRLLARDDESEDGTALILARAAQNDDRIEIVRDALGNLGTLGNFGELLRRAEGVSYLLLADQDDVWLPNKIAVLLGALRAREAVTGPNVPLLAFSDLRVGDADLNVTHPSFMDQQGFRAMIEPALQLPELITQNVAPGCSMLFNAALRASALPLPDCVPLHDWWLLLVAQVCGQVIWVPEALLIYRQHADNQLGAASLGAQILRQLRSGGRAYRERLHRAQQQAGMLVARFSAQLSVSDRETCLAFSRLTTLPPLLRQCVAARRRLHKCGLSRTLAFYALM